MEKEPKGLVRKFLNTEIPQEENEKFFSLARAKRGARIGAAAGFGISSSISAGAFTYAAIKTGNEITVNDVKDAGTFLLGMIEIWTGMCAVTGAAIDVSRPISRMNESAWKTQKGDIKSDLTAIAKPVKFLANKVRSRAR